MLSGVLKVEIGWMNVIVPLHTPVQWGSCFPYSQPASSLYLPYRLQTTLSRSFHL